MRFFQNKNTLSISLRADVLVIVFPIGKLRKKYHAEQNHIFFFSHPDFTVGFGIAPNQRLCARGLYRRWGVTPRPEEFLLLYYTL